MKRVLYFAVMLLLVFAACGAEQETGDCSAILYWQAGPVQSLRGELTGLLETVELEVQAGGKALGSQSCSYEAYRCVVEGVEAGKNRRLLARAYGAGQQLLYRGTAEGVEVRKGQLVEVPVAMTPAYTQDIYPPAAITDLSAQVQGQDVVLRWTAVGDDLRAGRAAAYLVRFHNQPIDESNFDGLTGRIDAAAPKISGQAEQLTVVGLPPGGTYYFAIKVEDDAGNRSPLSNVIDATIGN